MSAWCIRTWRTTPDQFCDSKPASLPVFFPRTGNSPTDSSNSLIVHCHQRQRLDKKRPRDNTESVANWLCDWQQARRAGTTLASAVRHRLAEAHCGKPRRGDTGGQLCERFSARRRWRKMIGKQRGRSIVMECSRRVALAVSALRGCRRKLPNCGGRYIRRPNKNRRRLISAAVTLGWHSTRCTRISCVVSRWEEAGDLLVSGNGKLTNVTARTGVTANQLHCVGANLYGGDDIISYQWLPATSGGTRTNGGDGTDTNVDDWVSLESDAELIDEPTTSGATEDPDSGESEAPPPYPIEPLSEGYEPIPEPLLPPGS